LLMCVCGDHVGSGNFFFSGVCSFYRLTTYTTHYSTPHHKHYSLHRLRASSQSGERAPSARRVCARGLGLRTPVSRQAGAYECVCARAEFVCVCEWSVCVECKLVVTACLSGVCVNILPPTTTHHPLPTTHHLQNDSGPVLAELKHRKKPDEAYCGVVPKQFVDAVLKVRTECVYVCV
jgi:hypothetical protein